MVELPHFYLIEVFVHVYYSSSKDPLLGTLHKIPHCGAWVSLLESSGPTFVSSPFVLVHPAPANVQSSVSAIKLYM